MIELTGRVALVTGASRGLGRACALRLAEAGADVIVNYVSSKSAAVQTAQAVAALGRRTMIVKADVSQEDDVKSMLDFISSEWGRLNILISNAATGGFRNVLDAKTSNFTSAFHTNVLALMYLMQAATPLLEKGPGRSKVIAISSHGSSHAFPSYGLIGASKAALESIVRHLTLEVGNRGVNINVVKAGLFATDSTRRLPGAEEMFARRTETTLVGDRLLETEDVANVVLFLASPLADLVQGEVVTVDGGAGYRIA